MTLSLRLRAETADLHRTLEDGLGLLDPGLILRRYASILAGFLAIHAALEGHALFEPAWRGLELDPGPRRKRRWLEEDLDRLRGSAEAGVAGERDRLHLPSRSAVLGAIYVAEGSTLGGRILYRHFQHVGGPDGSWRPARFFHGYGAETAARWKAFTGALDARTMAPGEVDEAVRGARHLYHRLACRTGVAVAAAETIPG